MEQFQGRMARIFQPNQALQLPHHVAISEVAHRPSPHFSHNIHPLSPGRQSSATAAVTHGHWGDEAPSAPADSRLSTAMKRVSFQGLHIIPLRSPAEAHHFLIWEHCRWHRSLSWKATALLVCVFHLDVFNASVVMQD